MQALVLAATITNNDNTLHDDVPTAMPMEADYFASFHGGANLFTDNDNVSTMPMGVVVSHDTRHDNINATMIDNNDAVRQKNGADLYDNLHNHLLPFC